MVHLWGNILEIKFNGDSYFFKAYYDLGESGFTNYSTTSLINWEKLTDIIRLTDLPSLTKVKILFFNSRIHLNQKVDDQPASDFYSSQAIFYVPKEKKKALKKLVSGLQK